MNERGTVKGREKRSGERGKADNEWTGGGRVWGSGLGDARGDQSKDDMKEAIEHGIVR